MFDRIKKMFAKEVKVELAYDEDDLLNEEEWEDDIAVEKIKAKHPG